MILGATGAGKTTAVAFLVGKGYQYLSDDIAAIRYDTLDICPYYKPMHLREGGQKILINNNIFFPYHAIGKTKNKRLVVSPPSPKKQFYQIENCYFIRRTTLDNATYKIENRTVCEQFLQNTIVPYCIDRELMRTLLLLSKVDCYFMVYSELSYLHSTIEQESQKEAF